MTPEQQAVIRDHVGRAIKDAADAWAAGEGCDELLDWDAEYCGALADAAIAAHLKALEAAGLCVAPVEPDLMMAQAGKNSLNRVSDDREFEDAEDCYRIMIAARPR
jgi:hypothetical protein